MTREFNTGGHAVKVVIPAGKKRKASAVEVGSLVLTCKWFGRRIRMR